MSFFDRVKGKIVFSVIIGVLLIAALSFFADFNKLGDTLRGFHWVLLPVIFGLTLFNYLLRYLKFDYYVHLVGANDVTKTESGLIFFSGMTMVMTPGKVGELLKAYLLRQVRGVPIATAAPIVLAERMTDGIAMMLLAVIGFGLLLLTSAGDNAAAAGSFWLILVFVVVGYAFVIALSQNKRLATWFIGQLQRLPVVGKRLGFMHELFDSTNKLLNIKALSIASLLGFISWAGECVAFYYVLIGLGIPGSWNLLFIATFILGSTSIAGAVSGSPGGLGVSDLAIVGALLALARPPFLPDYTINESTAIVATLLIRFATLWFGVLCGIVATVIFYLRYGSIGKLETSEIT